MPYLLFFKRHIFMASLLLALVLVTVYQCTSKNTVDPPQESIMNKISVLPIKLHEDWDTFADRVGHPQKSRPWHDVPINVLWNGFSLGYPTNPRTISVYFQHGRYSFRLDQVPMLTTINKGLIEQGIMEYDLSVNKKGQTDREVYDWTMGLLRELKSKGWKKYIRPLEPRLKGESSFDDDYESGLDPNYLLSFDKWQATRGMFSLKWTLYADGAVVEIWDSYYANDPKTGKPSSEHGFYLTSVTIFANESRFMSYDGSVEQRDGYLNRDLWQKDVSKHKADYQRLRSKAETEAKAAGKVIDEQYKDPEPPTRPTKASQTPATLPPDEPQASLRCRTGEVCPHSGIWEARLPEGHPFAAWFANSGMNRAFREGGSPMPPAGLKAEDERQVTWVWLYDRKQG